MKKYCQNCRIFGLYLSGSNLKDNFHEKVASFFIAMLIQTLSGTSFVHFYQYKQVKLVKKIEKGMSLLT